MKFSTRVGLLAGATALTLTGVSYAGPATEGTNDDLAQRLAAAEAKIAAMENANNQSWLTEKRAAEIKGLVQDVLADADTRASLLQSGITAGYDSTGFVLSDPHNDWLLKTNFLMQQRFVYNNQDNSGAEAFVDGDRYGFENTRTKFILSGHVVNPDWYYLADINIGNNGDRTGVGNAYLGHTYNSGLKIQMGAMKLPLLREELVDAQYQLAVERSNLNYLYTGGYADGIQAIYHQDQWQVMAMLSDGANSGETIWSTYDTEYALTGRFEFKLNGTWDQFKDFTSEPGGPAGVLLGAAAHYQIGEYGTPATETALTILTGDVSIEFGGANLYGAIVWNNVDPNGPGANANPWGIVVQGGFYLNNNWELFGRYEWSDLDIAGVDDLSILTGGVNYYFARHNAKWTTDIGYGLNSTVAPANITGFRPDVLGNDGQWVIRSQWQILF